MSDASFPRVTRALTLATLVLAGCATGLSRDAGLKVTGDGDTIRVAIAPDHPWAARFARTPPRLHAQYQAASGARVEENLSGATSTARGQFDFALPGALRNPSQGPVCLFLAFQGERSAVPVRLAEGTGTDTARFRYPEWEQSVTERSGQAVQTQALDRQQRALGAAESLAGTLRASLDARGVTDRASCDRLAAGGNARPARQPLAAADVAITARTVCLRKMARFDSAQTNPTYRFDMPALLRLADQQRISLSATQQGNASQIRQHLAQAAAGREEEHLSLAAETRALLKEWNSTPSRRSPDVLEALVYGLLQDFDSCAADTSRQLGIENEAIRRAQQLGPARQRAACLHDVGEWQKVEADRSRLQAEVAELLARTPQAQGPARGRSGPRELNFETCQDTPIRP